MSKYLFPILLLTFFWSAISMRGDGDLSVTMVASVPNPVSAPTLDDLSVAGAPALAAMNHGMSSFGGLAKDYLNVIAIMVVAVVLALRRRVFRRS